MAAVKLVPPAVLEGNEYIIINHVLLFVCRNSQKTDAV